MLHMYQGPGVHIRYSVFFCRCNRFRNLALTEAALNVLIMQAYDQYLLQSCSKIIEKTVKIGIVLYPQAT